MDIVYKGTDFGGEGFVIEENIKDFFINDDFKNNEIIFSLINGQDLNDDYLQISNRCIINFFDWEESKASTYTLPFQHIKTYVKPFRDKSNSDLDKRKWWIFSRRREPLYNKLKLTEQCFASSIVTKYLNLTQTSSEQIFSNATYVFTFEGFYYYLVIQSSIHNEWARKYSSTLETRLRYAPTDCFETFPFPQNLKQIQELQLETIGETYHEHRRQIMLSMQLGLTKTYNAFHAKEIQPGITTGILQSMDKKSIEKEYGKEVWNLWNHLQKMKNPVKGEAVDVCSIEEAIAGIIKLRELHVQMDNAVLEAYGWGSSPSGDAGVTLLHDFYEVDYLPENDRVRYTIHPDARKEVLKRLLELNHKIHEEEVEQGLWDKKGKGKKYKNSESELGRVDETDSSYGGLFNQE